MQFHEDLAKLPQNSVITLNQSVFRNEGRLNWEEFGRLRDYHVREIVFLGTQEFVEQTRENIREEVMTFIRKMNMDAYITLAADAFIMPKMIKYKKYQKLPQVCGPCHMKLSPHTYSFPSSDTFYT